MRQPTLRELVTNATKIHIVSHLNPDYDAYASLLFMNALLKKNFPQKRYSMSLETDQPNELMATLPGFSEISFIPLLSALERLAPDLIIIVDAPSVKRLTNETEKTNNYLTSTKSVIFDHHAIEETHVDLLINDDRYATVEVIYSYAREHELLLPERWEEYYLTGFIGDSYRFYYQVTNYRKSFEAIATILDHGYSIREYSDRLYGYSLKDMTVFKLLLKNLTSHGHYLFSFITWDEFHQEIENRITEAEFKKARRFFIDEFMAKNYDTEFALFIVPDDTVNDGKTYSGSIRAKESTIDCPTIASKLNGGGHNTGAGFTVVADTLEEATSQVLSTIAKFEQDARIAVKNYTN